MARKRVRRCRRARRHRAGVAPLELVLWLPLFMVLWMILLTTASVSLTKSEVIVQARHKAWKGRHQPWVRNNAFYSEGRLPSLGRSGRNLHTVGQVADRYFADNHRLPGNWSADRGFLHGEDEKKLRSFLAGFLGNLTHTRSDHYVLGGVWDHQELSFLRSTEPHGHGRLQFSTKFSYYAMPPRRMDFSPFRALGSFGGSF